MRKFFVILSLYCFVISFFPIAILLEMRSIINSISGIKYAHSANRLFSPRLNCTIFHIRESDKMIFSYKGAGTDFILNPIPFILQGLSPISRENAEKYFNLSDIKPLKRWNDVNPFKLKSIYF